ncbi:hypothetical protein I317_05679 [Kwoniella heveanensis CBS 569]|nr:hypothetical protein I317_05679 [Kwoniella heveanensis CBS 569]
MFPGLFPSHSSPSDVLSPPEPVLGQKYAPYISLMIPVLLAPWTLMFVLMIRQVTLRPMKEKTVTILVVGDIGRSPRMMYHASSFAKKGWQVFLIGYKETKPILDLIDNPLVKIYDLLEPPSLLSSFPWILRAPIRVFYQVYSIIQLAIWEIPVNTEVLLVQNPPSIPTLPVAQLISFASDAKLFVDWHNTGYSILGLRVGKNNPLTKIALGIERLFGGSAWAHLFVTKALEQYLATDWNLQGRRAVLHDRPPSHFHRTTPAVQHELFHRLSSLISSSLPANLRNKSSAENDSTPFTELSSTKEPVLRSDRPALVVSSTSWTADEDFSLLVTALDAYQAAITKFSKGKSTRLPKLIVLITGKGALRSSFEKTVAQREKTTWKDVTARCIFLPAEDYPVLLGSADLGVSLHTSSSGRDLPMKVVDMFGCGTPVLAKGFGCIGELVKEGKNGRIFRNGEELGEQLIEVLESFPEAPQLVELQSYFHGNGQKEAVDGFHAEWNTWDENWDKVVDEGLLSKLERD